MTTKKTIEEKKGVFFITFTCYKWLNLFSITDSYDLVYKWFDILISKNHQIIGYVIMPNHMHALIALNNSYQTINTLVSNGKRFMSYEIVKRLELQKSSEILHELTKHITPREQKKGQLHKVFEPSFDVKICTNEAFIIQKLEYIHNNPCNKKWMLAKGPVEYRYSSAMFYATYNENSKNTNSKITAYKELFVT
jgi:REP element-mobilizing transposase RayT